MRRELQVLRLYIVAILDTGSTSIVMATEWAVSHFADVRNARPISMKHNTGWE
ncbi:hypothetical protein SAMN05660666_03817 [Novosphingobium aromaticivorans]|nr:hypothetical protein SAMN05660666_03817 [Novosphingobium aromaticivorans]